MKNKNLTCQLKLIYLFIFIPILLFSCKKDFNGKNKAGEAKLFIKLIGISSEISNLPSTSSNNINAPIHATRNTVEVPINNDLSAYITLEETSNIKSKLNQKHKVAANDISQISDNILYGILVYEGNNLIHNGQKIIVAGNEEEIEAFALDGGKEYTFIAYSINSTTEIPTVINPNNLTEAQIIDESGDLLYYKHTQTVTTGVNNLNLILKHKYTLVTTTLQVGTTYAGVIQNIQNGQFNQTRESATINLENGDLEYSSTEKSSQIQFGSISQEGVATISSEPNLLIAPSSTDVVTYSFASITINNTTASIPLMNLNMQAGKKYNLILTFDVPCRTNNFILTNYENDEYVYDEEVDSLDDNFYRLRNDVPLVINFTSIDNNFNIFYNNKPLFEARYQRLTLQRSRTITINGPGDTTGTWGAWNEINPQWSDWVAHDADFQTTGSTSIQTMEFMDGTHLGEDLGTEVYRLVGTEEIPIIRLTISPSGSVTIVGNKNPSIVDDLIPIVPINNYILPAYPNGIPSLVIYDRSPVITSISGNIQTQTINSINKQLEFRMNPSLPMNADGKDFIRLRQSTMSMFPQGGEGITNLKGLFSPYLYKVCD